MKTPIMVMAIACIITLPMLSYGELVSHHTMTVDVASPPETCIICHDVSAHTSHPVSINYPPRGKEKEYASAAQVQAKGIKLVQGKVVCISCHDLRNERQKHLVISNEHSALCLTCHLKMG